MIYSNKFLNLFGSSLMIIVGFKIVYNKQISQGNASMGGDIINIGNYAYFVGGIFVCLGIAGLYVSYRSKS